MLITLALVLGLGASQAPAESGGRPPDTAEVGVVETAERDPTVFPDPSKFRRGFFAEGATGVAVPVGPTAEVLSPGFSLTARSGYEFRRWVALQAHVTGSISRYDDGILRSELLQQFYYTGEIRFGIPIRRFLIAFQGGVGLFQVSNNLLQISGAASSNRLWGFAYDGGIAFDIHSLSRHFSGGLVATYMGAPALSNSGAVTIQIYLRYTL